MNAVATIESEPRESATAPRRPLDRVVVDWMPTIGLVILPIVLAVSFYLWPLVKSFPHAPFPAGDGAFYVYEFGRMPELNGMWWRLGDDPVLGAPYVSAASRHPGLYEGVDLLLISAVTGKFLSPLWNYFALVVLVMAFNGWVVGALVRHLTKSYPAAALAIALVTINQATNFRVAGHIHLLKYGWFVLGCWAFSRYLDWPTWRRGLVLGLAMAMTLQGSFYFGYLLSVGLGVWWLGCLVKGKLSREHFKSAAVAAVTAGALAALLTFPVWIRPLSPEYRFRYLNETWRHSAELWQYWTPPGSHAGNSRVVASHRDGNGNIRYGTAFEGWYYLGMTIIASLAILAAMRMRGLRIVDDTAANNLINRMAGLFLVFVVLSLAGGPSAFLYPVVPTFRCYGRAGLIALVLSCILAPVTLHTLLRWQKTRLSRVAVLAMVLMLLAGDLSIAHHWRLKNIFGEPPPWVGWLAEQPADVRLVALSDLSIQSPSWLGDWCWDGAAYRVMHQHATLNGAAAAAIKADLEKHGCNFDQMTPDGLRFMASLGYNTFAFESAYLDRQPWIRDLPWLQKVGGGDGWSYYHFSSSLAVAGQPR